ncbi:MAG: TolC family protein [Chlamydiae bacterium]|nr:TolC family protein [Chlamydiota bacterium]MBI3265531.1 TolC family protein [Chlamydiota bacterium]
MQIFFKKVTLFIFNVGAFVILGCGSIPKNQDSREVNQVLEERLGYSRQSDEKKAENEIEKRVQVLFNEKLTSDSAVQIALLKNPSIQSAFEDLGIARADWVQAGLLKNPIFSGHARFPEGGEGDTNVECAIGTDLLDVLFLPLRKKLASSQFEKVKLRVSHEIMDVIADVKTHFYTLQFTMQIWTMRQMALKAAEISMEFASRQHEAGNISSLDWVNEKVVYEQAELDLIHSEADVEVAREKLIPLLGLSGKGEMSLQIENHLPELPSSDPSLEELEERALAQRLDLAAARKEIEILHRSLSLTQVGVIPSVNVAANTEKDSDGTRVTGPMWELELPLFDQKQPAIARVKNQIRKSQYELAAKENEIRSEVRILKGKMLTARKIVEIYRDKMIPLRGQVIVLTQQNYNYMLMGVYQLLQAKQNEISSQREGIEALGDYWIARVDLEQALGGRVPEAVSEKNSTVLPIQQIEVEQPLQSEMHHHHGGES